LRKIKNNKGFTLIELLGILVILTIILLVAIPNITSTFERNKQKINEQKKEVILSAAEIYANKYKEIFSYKNFLSGNCGIVVSEIKEKNLLTDSELLDSEGNEINITIGEETFKIKDVMIKYNNGNFEFVSLDDIKACWLVGDVNQDGTLSQEDVQLVLKHVGRQITLDEEQLKFADANEDGSVDSADYQHIDKIINKYFK